MRLLCLGGGRTNNGDLTDLSKQRLDAGVKLFESGAFDKIFALGGSYSTYKENAIKFDKTGAQLRKEYLIEHGVPEAGIIKVENCRDTLFEAFTSKKTAEKFDLKSILLVTSDKHLERALFIFRKIFGEECFHIEGVPVPCGNLLNSDEEKAYLNLVKNLFNKFPKDIPEPESWELWFSENHEFYEKQAEIHTIFLKGELETNQAYMGTKEIR